MAGRIFGHLRAFGPELGEGNVPVGSDGSDTGCTTGIVLVLVNRWQSRHVNTVFLNRDLPLVLRKTLICPHLLNTQY